jgi:predicted nucleotidyltransferase
MSNTPKAQSWQYCDDDIKLFVLDFVEMLKNTLGGNLVGVYLHGSLALGSYYRPKSDIDLIVVVQNIIGAETAKGVGIAIAEKASRRPTTGSVELTIITANVAKRVPVPPPFELHYSTEWHEKMLKGDVNYDSRRTDTDLLSHLMYVQQRGVVLSGRPIEAVFGTYNWQHFMDAVLDDLDWILEGENIVESPFYGVLNICRVLQLMSEDNHTVHSKNEGGEWALKNLPPKYHRLIQKALDIYRLPDGIDEEKRRTGGHEWDKDDLLDFRDYAKKAL